MWPHGQAAIALGSTSREHFPSPQKTLSTGYTSQQMNKKQTEVGNQAFRNTNFPILSSFFQHLLK